VRWHKVGAAAWERSDGSRIWQDTYQPVYTARHGDGAERRFYSRDGARLWVETQFAEKVIWAPAETVSMGL
jgi:hypothetical protein